MSRRRPVHYVVYVMGDTQHHILLIKRHVERVHTQKRELVSTTEEYNTSFYTKKDRTDHIRKQCNVKKLNCGKSEKKFAYERNFK
jgi:hypothetical protein